VGSDQNLPGQNVGNKGFASSTRRIDGGCSQAAVRRRLCLTIRPVCAVRLASSSGSGNLSNSGNRVCFDFRTGGHLNPDRKDGLHSSGSGGRVGAGLNGGTGSDGIAECAKEGKTFGSASDSATEPSRASESKSRSSDGEIQSEAIGKKIRNPSLGHAAGDNGAKRGI